MKPILFLPFLGGFLGYVGAQMFGVEDGLARFAIAVLCMILAVAGGMLVSRRSTGSMN